MVSRAACWLSCFPPATLLQQTLVLAALLLLRARMPSPSPLALPNGLGAAMDVVFAAGAVMTVDPTTCSHYLGPSFSPRSRRRLARIAALLRWIVFVPSGCRCVLYCCFALAHPHPRASFDLALCGFFTSLRMLPLD